MKTLGTINAIISYSHKIVTGYVLAGVGGLGL
jgi:hypothetical protein